MALVVDKNVSLGEMVSRQDAHGIRVPNGFATTALAYFDLLSTNNLIHTYSHRCFMVAPSPSAPSCGFDYLHAGLSIGVQ